MDTKFVIYYDKPNTHDIKIHRITCHYYKNRKQAPTSIWEKFSTLEKIQERLEELKKERDTGFRKCKICRPPAF